MVKNVKTIDRLYTCLVIANGKESHFVPIKLSMAQLSDDNLHTSYQFINGSFEHVSYVC